ncbi:MAG: hypothetical protein ACFE8M_06345 [Candidatus Hermodarchaeota archaeon]
MMSYTRKDLVQSDATMNQMRNAIYHLERFMKNNSISEIKQRFHRMGQNIANTYIKHWKPIDKVDITNIKSVLATIYKNILNSSVSIEINDHEKLVIIRDNDCPLCKYHFEDIEVAGCEIIAAMVVELVSLINKQATNNPSFSIHPIEIKESRTFGNKSCIQLFKYSNGGE